MHTASELFASSFAIRVDGQPGQIADVYPDFTADDRLGVVIARPLGAIGASLAILAAVTAFYDIQRARSDDFWIYPDFFAFHVGALHGDHSGFDIWPGHKEVVVAPDPTLVLQAINDRGVTRLLVEDGPSVAPAIEREAQTSARGRLRTVLAYGPRGRVDGADIEIAGDDVTDAYGRWMVDPHAVLAIDDDGPYAQAVRARLDEVGDDVRRQAAEQRAELRQDGRTTESYRRVTVDAAFTMLAPAGRSGRSTIRR